MSFLKRMPDSMTINTTVLQLVRVFSAVRMVTLKWGRLAAASAKALGTIALSGLTVPADKTIITGHECSWIGLIATLTLREEIGLTRSHRIAADESVCADACPSVSM
jgi:hypothetical protein